MDRFHHGREEYILYPALKDEGVPECPLSELFAEHEITRSLAKAIRGHIEDYKQQDASSKIPPEILEGCLSYTGLLLDHMDTEEKIFFPLADECFTKEAQERMAEKFQILELEQDWARKEGGAEGAHRSPQELLLRFIDQITKITKIYLRCQPG